MTPKRWQEVMRLFTLARERPADEREAFVRREAGSDVELASEVLRLLNAKPEPGFLGPPEPIPAPASRQLGDFELLEEIGRGGMGVVYRARQISLGRIVAVKVLPPSLTLTPRQIDRFLREARAAARLHHPNIVSIFTVGEAQGTRYFAMDYVAGPDLAEELNRLREQNAVVTEDGAHLPSSQAETYFRSVAEVVRQVADGLHCAHQHGVVHRDVKPSNLLLDAQGVVHIVDFGLARDEEQGTITRTGELAGTPHYMSPEQARARGHRIDHRTDVYSLGVVLYELLTLRRPFEGKSSQEVIHNLLQGHPTGVRKLNRRVPRDLETICMTAMAMEPGERYASAADLRDELRRFLSHESILARPPALAQRARRWAHRHRRALAIAGTALVAVSIGILLAHAEARRARTAENVQALAVARAEGPLAALPVGRAIALRALLEELRADGGIRAAETDEVRAAERDFDALWTELKQKGLADLAFARDNTQPEGSREMRRLNGLQTLLKASYLFPEDDELQRLASIEAAFPSLMVRALDEGGAEVPAEVFLRAIDVYTGEVGKKSSLGRAPLQAPVEPGYYRVVVVFAAGGSCELVCNPGPALMDVELVAHRRANRERVTEGMILVHGGSFMMPSWKVVPSYPASPVALEDYWLDRTEVSNRAFQAFVADTGHPLPEAWTRIDDLLAFLERYGDRPVNVTNWRDAVDYAEWAGKRLPTAAEWNRAAGGPESWPTPYSPDPAAPARGNVLAPNEQRPVPGAALRSYLEHSVAVDSAPEAASPEGFLHMFGNMYELTESMALLPVPGGRGVVPHPYERFAYGGGWDIAARGVPMYAPYSWALGDSYTDNQMGFRCARSAEP